MSRPFATTKAPIDGSGSHARTRAGASAHPRPAMRTACTLLVACAALLWHAPAPAQSAPGATKLNGFVLDGASIPVDQILPGGPPRDGIPAIDTPRFVAADAAGLEADDRVLGLVRNGVARAYPVRILNWHEVVNDRIGDERIVITYCPLCGSGIAFGADVGGRTRSFGVSGLLFNSDVLLYDRETESLWSQLLGEAVTGPARGTRLRAVTLDHTSWADWRARHPETRVLSFETGYLRNYARDPYAGYERDPRTFFPVAASDPRYHAKAWVLGVEASGARKAYPFAELENAPQPLADRLGGREIEVIYDAEHRTARVRDADGAPYPSVMTFWFAWVAFFPDTQVYRAPR
ncbi:MAG: DUF3179 domain-containing protein [Burkholderiales bacterium]|nr:MAG: DUF3179 domain-containing protein [Burkholderiales bacterium]